MEKVILLGMCGLVVWNILRVRQALPALRKIPALEVFEEAVGRSAELGRPVFFSPGWGEMLKLSPVQFASLSLISAGARLSARLSLPFFITVARPAGFYPMVEEAVRTAYAAEGLESLFHPENVEYVSEDQSVYAAASAGNITRHRPGACLLLGDFGFESLIIAEAGQRVGAFQIAGTPHYFQIPFFICSCDYTLIGEEYYAASIYLSREPPLAGSLVGQDWLKAFLLLLALLGSLYTTLSSFLL